MGDVTLVGTLGRDPELRFTNGGRAIASCSLAVTRKWKQGDEWQESTSWFNLSAWGELGENFAQSCTKGCRVIANGRLEIREYERKDGGGKGTSVDLIADSIGPDLRWATAQVERVARSNANDTGSRQQSPGKGQKQQDAYDYGYGDSEPF